MQNRIMNAVYRTGITTRDVRFKEAYRREETQEKLREDGIRRLSQIRQDQIRLEQRRRFQEKIDRTEADLSRSLQEDLKKLAQGHRYTPTKTLAALYQKQSAILMGLGA
jgi:hypothetical protein